MRSKYIIKIFGNNAESIRDVTIKSWHIKAFFAIMFVIMAFFTFATYRAVKYTIDTSKMTRYQRENEYLRIHLKDMEAKITHLDSLIDRYYEDNASIRVKAGIPIPPRQFKEVGIGGELEEPPYPVQKEAFYSEEKLNKLLRFTKMQLNSFNQIEKKLAASQFIRDHTPSIYPTNGRLTSPFGYRIDPFTGKRKFHYGIDLAAPIGTPVYAPADGTVSLIRRNMRGYGLELEIKHGFGISTRYGHLSAILVKLGQKVKRGQMIARIGNTGRSTGPHLHYEVRVLGKPVNPINYIIPDTAYYE